YPPHRLPHLTVVPRDVRVHLRLGQAARHHAQDQAPRYCHRECRFPTQPHRLQSRAHPQAHRRLRLESVRKPQIPPKPAGKSNKTPRKASIFNVFQQSPRRVSTRPNRVTIPRGHGRAQAAGLTMSDWGMEALQCAPVGNSSSLAVPPNMSPAIRSRMVRPNPKWVGDFTAGPSLSRQLRRTDFGTKSHRIMIFPAGTESAPYFEALVASSCRIIPNDWAA